MDWGKKKKEEKKEENTRDRSVPDGSDNQNVFKRRENLRSKNAFASLLETPHLDNLRAKPFQELFETSLG